MKCPRCGHEMTLDTHRKYALNMCYECGYIEGRLIDPEKKGETNFERLKKLNVCPHFHLSMQSGCDETLARMRRKYTTAEFFAVTERLRAAFPGWSNASPSIRS